jgi:uncharacterized protein
MALVLCPTCGLPFESEGAPAMPFCSERCRLIDLGRWLNEEQRLPIEPAEDELLDDRENEHGG